LEWRAQFVDQDDVEVGAESIRDDAGHRHATTRNAQHERLPLAVGLEPTSELFGCVLTIPESHGMLLEIWCEQRSIRAPPSRQPAVVQHDDRGPRVLSRAAWGRSRSGPLDAITAVAGRRFEPPVVWHSSC
jgi:hypothetical protein